MKRAVLYLQVSTQDQTCRVKTVASVGPWSGVVGFFVGLLRAQG